MGVSVSVSQIALEAVWAACFNLEPYLEAFDVENVITLPWKSLDALVLHKVLEADVAARKAQVSVSLKKDHCLYLSEVLIVI